MTISFSKEILLVSVKVLKVWRWMADSSTIQST